MDRFVERFGLNRLQLSVTKTKELVVDFRTQLNSVTNRGIDMDSLDSYNYLGVHLDSNLVWTINH